MIVYHNTIEHTNTLDALSRKEYDFEFEQRINFGYNTVTNILFLTYIVLVYNNFDNIGVLFLSLVVLFSGIYLSLRYIIFLYKYDDMMTFRRKVIIFNYIISSVFVVASLLVSSLALVNLN